MRVDLSIVTQFLRRSAPFSLVTLLLGLLSASGIWLHESPRFGGFSWGVTEMVHIYVGWVFLAIFVGFLVHHLSVRWGTLRSLQRCLGLALVTATACELLSGAFLATGRTGGTPAWVLSLHYLAMPALVGLLLLHLLRPLSSRLRGSRIQSPHISCKK
jgi:hypothetical protein